MENTEKKFKVIFSPQLANYLLKNNYNIVKLKPKHNTENESVYVFEVKDGFYDVMEEWTSLVDDEEAIN